VFLFFQVPTLLVFVQLRKKKICSELLTEIHAKSVTSIQRQLMKLNKRKTGPAKHISTEPERKSNEIYETSGTAAGNGELGTERDKQGTCNASIKANCGAAVNNSRTLYNTVRAPSMNNFKNTFFVHVQQFFCVKYIESDRYRTNQQKRRNKHNINVNISTA